MRVIATALAAAALAASAAPGFAAEPAPAAPIAWVKLSSCSRADQSAVFYGRMRRSEPGQRMSMRFTLLESRPEGGFQPVRGAGLGRWRKSKPGVRAFGYRQRVRGLTLGVTYRAQVDFRWHDAEGELARSARRRSRVCSQAPQQPNLRSRVTKAAPTLTPGVVRYSVRVANVGGAEADDVAVRLSANGSVVDTKAVPPLDAGEFKLVHFRGPACETGVQALADPDDVLPESSESDNGHSLACGDLPQS